MRSIADWFDDFEKAMVEAARKARGTHKGDFETAVRDIIEDTMGEVIQDIDKRFKRLEAFGPCQEDDEEDPVLEKLSNIDAHIKHMQSSIDRLNTAFYKLRETFGKD